MDTDVLFVMVKQAVELPPSWMLKLRCVVASATLDAARVQPMLRQQLRFYEYPGRSHPLDAHHASSRR